MARSRIARFTRKAKIQVRAARKVPVSSSGGGMVVWKALNQLGLGRILTDLGMVSRGWALTKVVFDLVLQAWLQADSITGLAGQVNADALLAELGAPADRTTLTRILDRRRYRWQELFRHLAYATWNALRLPPSAPVTLVIHDTAIAKSGVKMEGSSWVYDSSQNKKVWGYTVVTAARVAVGHRIPVKSRHHRSGEWNGKCLSHDDEAQRQQQSRVDHRIGHAKGRLTALSARASMGMMMVPRAAPTEAKRIAGMVFLPGRRP